MKGKKLLALAMVFAFALSYFPLSIQFAQATKSAGVYANENYAAEVSELTYGNWDENYFSSIILEVGKSTMTKDGEEIRIFPATEENDELKLPLADIAEAIGATVNINDKSGDITVKFDDKLTTLRRSDMAVKSGSKLLSKNVSENGLVTYTYEGGVMKADLPLFSVEEVQNALNLSVAINGDKIVITRPFQTKQLVAQMLPGKELQGYNGATHCVYNGEGRYFLVYETEESAIAAYEQFKTNDDIDYVAPNTVYRQSSVAVDNWGYERTATELMYDHVSAIPNEDDIIVAVVDSGLDTTSPFVQGRYVDGYNVIANNTNIYEASATGHGTQVSSLIISCTPENVKIMPIISLQYGIATEEDLVTGVMFAKNNGADVLNMSFVGYESEDPDVVCLLEIAVREAYDAGVVCVAGAGNDAMEIGDMICPAKLDYVITVAAVDENDKIADFSNYGDSIDVCAPGVDVLVGGMIQSWNTEGLYTVSGTSYSSPQVAAFAAMLLMEDSEIDPDEMKSIICDTTVPLGEAPWNSAYGAGVVDFRKYFDFTDIPVTELGFAEAEVEVEISELVELHLLDINVAPMNATDKSYTVLFSDPSIAEYKSGRIIPKQYGTTTMTISAVLGEAEANCEITVAPSKSWFDYAADSFDGGIGTKDDPYRIATVEQLAKLARDCYYGERYGEVDAYGIVISQQNFILTEDIDLAGKEWTPICAHIGDEVYAFLGNFDGNNKAISNMTITRDEFLNGLFGFVSANSITNLALKGAEVTNGYYGGLLAGVTYDTEVSNCYTSGSTISVGFINEMNGGNLKNCFSTADAEEGGFLGQSISVNSVVISNCYSSGYVKYGSAFITGLGGLWGTDVTLVNCFSAGETTGDNGFLSGYYYDTTIRNTYYAQGRMLPTAYGGDGVDGLSPREISYFKDGASYAIAEDWDSNYNWDFEDVWTIDPEINEGLPYLKNLPAPEEKQTTVTDTWLDFAADNFAGGTGTQSNPFVIENASHLAKLIRSYKYGGGADVWFTIVNDINLEGNLWYPIGKGDDINSKYEDDASFYQFTGNILGNGNTIRNLTVESTGDTIGFISYFSGAIYDLTFENVNIVGNNFTAGIAGISESAIIANTIVDGTISGNECVGGVVGANAVPANLVGVSFRGTVTGNDIVGGLAGYNEAGTIDRCSVEASINCGSGNMGGLTYLNRGIIKDSYCIDKANANALVVYNDYGKISNSYYVSASNNVLYTNSRDLNAVGETKTMAQMKEVATFEGFDFDSVWAITSSVNDGYPYLNAVASGDFIAPVTRWIDYAADEFDSGDGTQDDPYIIKTPEQLAKMIKDYMLFGGWGEEYTVYLKLANDIDMSGHGWDSIGVEGSFYYYMNFVLDGNNKKIDNLYLLKRGGFVGAMDSTAVIKNLGMTNVKGKGEGVITSWNAGGLIENCYITGELLPPTISNRLGGITESNSGLINECFTDINVTAASVGGIAESNDGGLIMNSYNIGTVMGLQGIAYVPSGALVGGNNSSIFGGECGVIYRCYSAGENIGPFGAYGTTQDPGSLIQIYFDQEKAFNGEYTGYEYGKTTAQMKDISTYAGWDFDTVWAIDPSVNSGYPYLRNTAVDVVFPVITSQPEDATVIVGDELALSVEAVVEDGYELSYQWYMNSVEAIQGATIISGATLPSYDVPTDTAGEYYYFVLVSCKNSTTGAASGYVVSDIVKVVVQNMPLVYEPGDVNRDGAVNTGDAALILQSVVGLKTLDDEQKVLADVNGDDAANTGDAAYILRRLVGA